MYLINQVERNEFYCIYIVHNDPYISIGGN